MLAMARFGTNSTRGQPKFFRGVRTSCMNGPSVIKLPLTTVAIAPVAPLGSVECHTPPHGFLKVNFDATINVTSGKVGFGGSSETIVELLSWHAKFQALTSGHLSRLRL